MASQASPLIKKNKNPATPSRRAHAFQSFFSMFRRYFDAFSACLRHTNKMPANFVGQNKQASFFAGYQKSEKRTKKPQPQAEIIPTCIFAASSY
jgi:hypothetical protein